MSTRRMSTRRMSTRRKWTRQNVTDPSLIFLTIFSTVGPKHGR